MLNHKTSLHRVLLGRPFDNIFIMNENAQHVVTVFYLVLLAETDDLLAAAANFLLPPFCFPPAATLVVAAIFLT